MTNLLFDPTNWEDPDNTTPPAAWNGTGYTKLGDTPVDYTIFRINPSPTQVVADGDVVQGTAYAIGDGGGIPAFLIYDDGDTIDTITLEEGVAVPFSFAAREGGALYYGFDGEGHGTSLYYGLALVTPTAVEVSYNCECEDASGNRTLKELRDDMMRRMGWGAQVNNPPPGIADMLNSFLQGAQRALYRRYDVLRTERIYRWDLVAGVRYYDLDGNSDVCTKRLDPRKVRWVGIERDGLWSQLVCGIAPEHYSFDQTGWPTRYEIRQCIEIWPAPDSTPMVLRVKGHFELEPFAVDGDKTTIDDELVFLLALANAKSHYGQPDAANYVGQMEAMMANLVAGSHHTRRYVPGLPARTLEPEPVWVSGTWPPP